MGLATNSRATYPLWALFLYRQAIRYSIQTRAGRIGLIGLGTVHGNSIAPYESP